MAAIVNARDIYLQGSSRTTPLTLSLSSSITGYGVDIYATNTSSVSINSYTYSLGNNVDNSFVSSTLLGTYGSIYTWKAQVPGIYTIWCFGTDRSGNNTAPVSTVVIISAPGLNTIQSVIQGRNLKLTWSLSTSDFVIDKYEIRYGSSWEGGITVASTYSTTYIHRADYLGSRIWWVAAQNIAGSYSTPTGVNVNINKPTQVSNIQASVVDNNALLSWTAGSIGVGQLPIGSYIVKKGNTYESSVVVGSNGNSDFTSIFEQVGGTFTYWVVPVDTAGNEGTQLGSNVVINQPPDYILRNDYYSNFTGGTAVNFYIESGSLVGPTVLGQTWQTHFVANSWATPQAQVTAEFPIYATPSLATGSYEEIIDYLTNIPSTVITSTITVINVAGTVSNSCQISHKLLATDPWILLSAGTTGLLPTFRYVRVQYSFTGGGGNNLIKISSLNIKLAIKHKGDSGNAVYDSTKTDLQNTIPFKLSFVSADTPIVQPNNSIPLTAVVIYNGGTNPTGFSVRFFTSGGVATSSPYSWSVRGY